MEEGRRDREIGEGRGLRPAVGGPRRSDAPECPRRGAPRPGPAGGTRRAPRVPPLVPRGPVTESRANGRGAGAPINHNILGNRKLLNTRCWGPARKPFGPRAGRSSTGSPLARPGGCARPGAQAPPHIPRLTRGDPTRNQRQPRLARALFAHRPCSVHRHIHMGSRTPGGADRPRGRCAGPEKTARSPEAIPPQRWPAREPTHPSLPGRATMPPWLGPPAPRRPRPVSSSPAAASSAAPSLWPRAHAGLAPASSSSIGRKYGPAPGPAAWPTTTAPCPTCPAR